MDDPVFLVFADLMEQESRDWKAVYFAARALSTETLLAFPRDSLGKLAAICNNVYLISN